MLKKTVFYVAVYDKEGEHTYDALCTEYRLFGLLLYERMIDDQAAQRYPEFI